MRDQGKQEIECRDPRSCVTGSNKAVTGALTSMFRSLARTWSVEGGPHLFQETDKVAGDVEMLRLIDRMAAVSLTLFWIQDLLSLWLIEEVAVAEQSSGSFPSPWQPTTSLNGLGDAGRLCVCKAGAGCMR